MRASDSQLSCAKRLGLGCATLGREIDEATSFQVLDHAFDCGIRLFDTAEAYGGGQAREARRKATGIEDVREVSGELHSSELILGRWLRARGCRQHVIVQTKVTPPLGARRVLESLDASLNRLGVDCVDTFMFHAPDPATPLDISLASLAEARRAGKIQSIGVSNFSAEQLKEAIRLAQPLGLRIELIQSNYNLAVRDIEPQLLPLCKAAGIAVQTYSPLGAGFLTGKYGDDPDHLPQGSRFHIVPGHTQIYFADDKFALVRRLKTLAIRTGFSMAKLALAWVLSKSDVDRVLIGARSAEQIDQAVDAAQIKCDPQWEKELML
jgi:aryl-alcohol dehydrogenase (NADP+)